MGNLITWVEIPVKQIERAIKFYSAILDIHIEREDIDNQYKYATFETGDCALIEGRNFETIAKGVLIYMEVEEMDWVLDQVTLHGRSGRLHFQRRVPVTAAPCLGRCVARRAGLR